MLYAQGLEVHTKCIVDWETHEQLLTNTSICQSNQPKPLDDIEFIPPPPPPKKKSTWECPYILPRTKDSTPD